MSIVITYGQAIHGLMCGLARLSGAEHEHQYLHGGCPECATADEPEKGAGR